VTSNNIKNYNEEAATINENLKITINELKQNTTTAIDQFFLTNQQLIYRSSNPKIMSKYHDLIKQHHVESNRRLHAEMYNHVILKVIMITIMITLNFKIMIMIKIMITRKI